MKLFSRLLAYLVVPCVVAVAGLSGGTQTVMAAQITNPCTGLGIQSVSLTPVMPTAFSSLAKSQVGANCLAWQEFIDLNWQADPTQPGVADPKVPGTAFGEPGNVNPTVWESYLEATDVFRSAILNSDLIGRNNIKSTAQMIWRQPRPPLKTLSRLSKLGDTSIQLSSVTQADGGWLTSQSGVLAFYEIKINQDEYEFITTNVDSKGNNLTTFAGQAACASRPGIKGRGGFNLPAGNNSGNQDTDCQGNNAKYGQNVGSIEVKASWVVLPADGSLNYRYKISQAEINDPSGKKINATVGLAGLHIIHKVPGAPQFVWATFEQIDNSPDDNHGHPAPPVLPTNTNQKQSSGYSFFNTACTISIDPVYQCIPNTQPGPPCPANGPVPAGCTPYSAPLQVTRLTPVQDEANIVTAYAWSLMPKDSVFNYYRLIDVQWPNAPSPVAPGTTTNKMPAGDITPSPNTRFVANTTMETFVQTKQSCMSCHQFAPIAQAQQQSKALRGGLPTRKITLSLDPRAGNSLPASDYSFIFSAETNK